MMRACLLGRDGDVDREHLVARRHHVARALLAELHDAGDDRDLVVLAHALERALAQQVLDPLARVLGGRARRLRGDGRATTWPTARMGATSTSRRAAAARAPARARPTSAARPRAARLARASTASESTRSAARGPRVGAGRRDGRAAEEDRERDRGPGVSSRRCGRSRYSSASERRRAAAPPSGAARCGSPSAPRPRRA
jgi:hypothetical protein